MMVGYYTYGSISNETNKSIQKNGLVEGSSWYRELYLDFLVKNGYEIYLMNEKRDWKKYKKFKSVKKSRIFNPKEFYTICDWTKVDGSIKLELSWQDMYKKLDQVTWPKLDLLIIDNAGYPFFPIFTYKLMLILAYKDKIPVIVLDDDDSTLPLLQRANKILGTKIEDDIFIATHYKQQLFTKQLFFPFPYNEKLEQKVLPVNKLEHDYVYIGHDYDRRDKMLKFYIDLVPNILQWPVEIYGDWSKWLESKKAEKYSKDIFKGSIAQSEGFKLLNKTLMTTIVVPPYCEERGHITPRLNEAVMAGAQVLADFEIKTIEDYILKENIVGNGADIYIKYDQFKHQTFRQRRDMIEAQREISRKFDIDSIWKKILENIK